MPESEDQDDCFALGQQAKDWYEAELLRYHAYLEALFSTAMAPPIRLLSLAKLA